MGQQAESQRDDGIKKMFDHNLAIIVDRSQVDGPIPFSESLCILNELLRLELIDGNRDRLRGLDKIFGQITGMFHVEHIRELLDDVKRLFQDEAGRCVDRKAC